MNPNEDTPIQPGQKWEVRSFRPEDAEGVARLFRSVYGDGYPVRTYLEPELLIRENEARRTISSVAVTQGGDVVGHNALYNSAPYPGTYESGAGLVHMTYRRSGGMFVKMVSHGLDLAGKLPEVETVFGEPVCNHVISQKLCYKFKLITLALEVDLMPAEAYEKEESATGRVAAFLDFKTYKSKPHTVYLPESYEQDLRFLYQEFDDERVLIFAGASSLFDTSSDIRPEVFDYAAVARIAIHSAGTDFETRMQELNTKLSEDGVLVNQVWLKADKPWIAPAVEILRQQGYFLGGVLPRWFDTDGLLMQKTDKEPDWDAIRTFPGRHNSVFNLVNADWRKVKYDTAP